MITSFESINTPEVLKLEPLFGTVNRARALSYLPAFEEGYPLEEAKYFATDLRAIQSQFEKLEAARGDGH